MTQTVDLATLRLTPEFRSEVVLQLAKTPVHLTALIAEAIRDAVKQDRKYLGEKLQEQIKLCLCVEESSPCNGCISIARIQGLISGLSLESVDFMTMKASLDALSK